MMYLLTEQEHAQVVEALELPSLKTVSMLIKRDDALAMLKAMRPVEPCAWQRKDDDLITAKEKRPDYAYTHYYDKPLYAKEQQ